MSGSPMTDAEHREANRLRSERWRRAHGIMPRRPAQRPWLEAGCSRSTYYRRRAKARQQAAQTLVGAPPLKFALDRAEAFTRILQAELTAAAGFQAVMTSILNERLPKSLS
jgi:hypothetical protein